MTAAKVKPNAPHRLIVEGRDRRVDKRSAVHQRRRGLWWTALSLVHPTAGTMIKARAGSIGADRGRREAQGGGGLGER